MFRDWLKTLFSGKPHFTVGSTDRPYMLRWYILPRNPYLNLYLHKFLRDDDDRALHDHPWWFVSLMLKGGYWEVTPYRDSEHSNTVIKRQAGSVAFRRATHRHRVVLFAHTGKSEPCWTLVLTGAKHRTWGFWCPKGFVPWHQFVDADDAGNVGRGCGEMS